jgi:hypothetical protein
VQHNDNCILTAIWPTATSDIEIWEGEEQDQCMANAFLCVPCCKELDSAELDVQMEAQRHSGICTSEAQSSDKAREVDC